MVLILLVSILVILFNEISSNIFIKNELTAGEKRNMIEKALTYNIMCTEEEIKGNMCYNLDMSDDEIPAFEDRTSPFTEESIFFIDASCNGGLTLRQACAIEAAALAHPQREINVLFAGPITTKCLTNSPIWDLLHYENVNMYRLNLNEIFNGTPIEILLFATERRFPVQYIADILRFVILYKYGGVYLDMDVMVVKPLDKLPEPRNYVAKMSNSSIGAGVMAFSRRGPAQMVADAVLRRYRSVFKANADLSTSDYILTEVIKKLCDAAKTNISHSRECGGIHLYDSVYFYPVQPELWRYYFTTSYYEVPTEPFAFYIWNSITETESIYEGSLFARLINNHCPRIKQSRYEGESIISA